VRRSLLTLALATQGAAIAHGAALEEREWQLVTSENFRIHSVLGTERTTELLRHLEIMRKTLDRDSDEPTWRASVPTIILAVDRHEDYAAIGAPENTVGFFVADLRENAILFEDGDDAEGIEVILHEYVHYLSQRNARIRYPKWYEEGRAEYMAASQLHDQVLEVGMPNRRRLFSLNFERWLPLPEILEQTDLTELDDVTGDLFYGQSWLLVHYLSNHERFADHMAEYLERFNTYVVEGRDRVTAFEEAFGLDIDDLEKALLEYFVAGRFESRRIPADTALPDFSPRVRPLTAPEVRLSLAQMAMRLDNYTAADRWFRAAQYELDDIARAHAEAGLGRLRGIEGDVDTARGHFEKAVSLTSWDFRIWMDYAQFWAQRVAVTTDKTQRQRYARRLKEALQNGLTIRDATPELNSLMGLAYLALGEDLREAVAYLEAASEAVPTDQGSLLLLANAYLFLGRPDRAVEAAHTILGLQHEHGPIAEAAQDVINRARLARVRN